MSENPFRKALREAPDETWLDKLARVSLEAAEAEFYPDAGLPTSVTCPRCGLTSHHPKDVEQGYCSKCHDWTSRDQR